METASMGKTVVTAKIENMEDLFGVIRGSMKPEEVRTIEVPDALVDTGATLLSIPKRYIDQLGLRPFQTRRARSSTGITESQIYGMARLTIQGRECRVDVAEIADECPVLIGQVPLEQLDFVVDPIARELIGNPEHGGEHMFDLF